MLLGSTRTKSAPSRPYTGAWLVLALALVSFALTGCVQRRLTIRSNPPGALVYVDNEEIGQTPVATDFIYYGTRQIRLVKDGFETLTVLQPIPAPWYQVFPIDFFAENVVPGEIRDERVLDFNLVPQTIVHGDQLLQRAEDLRRTTQATIPNAPLVPGAIVGPPVIQPPPAAPPRLISPPPAAQQQLIQPLPGQAIPIQPLPAQPLPTQPQSLPPPFVQPLPSTTSPFQSSPRGVLDNAL